MTETNKEFHRADIKYFEAHVGITPRVCPPAICIACANFNADSLVCTNFKASMMIARGRWNCLLDPEILLINICEEFTPTLLARSIKDIDRTYSCGL